MSVMAKEWIDPRYAELVVAWKRTQLPTTRGPEPRPPRRAFIVPPKA